MKLIQVLILTLLLSVICINSMYLKNSSKAKTRLPPLPEWLTKKDNGEYKLQDSKCDNLEEKIDFYTEFVTHDQKVVNNALFY